MIVFFGVLFLFVIPVVVYLLRRDVRRLVGPRLAPSASDGSVPRAKSTTTTYYR